MSSAYLSDSFTQNELLNLEDMKESFLIIQISLFFSFKVEQSSSKFTHLDVLKQQACMTNKLMSDIQEILITLLHCSELRSQS